MLEVYVLYNAVANKIYIGQTNNLKVRLASHNNKRGNHFTAKFEGDWELIYSESVATRSEALQRERQLKSSRGRAFVKKYIPG
ncbi:GIY-YIG nuclease family protein [Candidatus Saccharibacteria bacterium]|nr:MAG: GIY-YIG nuclease family protein [Candidatus Saccharibacteria bacterium]